MFELSLVELVSGYRAKYEAALELFEQAGIRLAPTRLQAYRRTLADLASMDVSEVERIGRYDELIQTLFEVSDIVDIARLPREHLASPVGRQKLETVATGRRFAIDYAQGEHDAARDTAFELSAAAYLHSTGVFAGLSTNGGDILVRHGACIRPAECKRLTTPNATNDQMRSIYRRLKREVKDFGLPAGIGMIDATMATRAPENVLREKTDYRIRRRGDQLFKSFVLEHRSVLQHDTRIDPAVLGIAVRMSFVAISGRSSNLRRYQTWHFLHSRKDDTPEGAVFFDLVESLGTGRVVRHQDPIPPLHDALRNFLTAEVAIPPDEPLFPQFPGVIERDDS